MIEFVWHSQDIKNFCVINKVERIENVNFGQIQILDLNQKLYFIAGLARPLSAGNQMLAFQGGVQIFLEKNELGIFYILNSMYGLKDIGMDNNLIMGWNGYPSLHFL